MRIVRYLALLLLVISASLASAQAPRYESELRAFEEFVQKQLATGDFAAISVAVMKDDFVWAKGFGYADIENNVPASAESSYRMGSVTKPMTGVAVMKLVEQGKIDLDAEVQKYVPDFPRQKYPITVRQLLGHLGGISHYRNYQVEGRFKEPKNTREALAVFQDFDLVAEPGTRYAYSSYGYNLLGAVIEGASGKSYGDFMRSEVWGPLGMTNTLMDNPRAIIPNRVRGYERVNGKLRNSEFVDISSRFAAGGTRSTVGDLIKFVQGMESAKILKPETMDLMWTGLSTKAGTATRYALGWNVTPFSGRFVVNHGGSQQETRTQLTYVPRERFAIALASNVEDANLNVFESRLAQLFLGDTWNSSFYVEAKTDQSILTALGSSFNNGVGYYDRHGKPRTSDASELGEAFRYFKETVSSKRLASVQGDDKMLSEGRHPAGKEAFIKVGSYMADRLARAGRDLDVYQRSGELAFFADYVDLYRRGGEIPRNYRFDSATEKALERWNRDWQRVWTADIRNLEVAAIAGSSELAALLRSRFQGASILPNYVGDFVSAAEAAVQQGDPGRAWKLASVALNLYPESEGANGLSGVLTLIGGDVERGRSLMKKAASLNPNGYVGAGRLSEIARFLSRDPRTRTAAMQLLEVATEIHPREASLFVQLGDASREAGMKDKARAAYQRALTIDAESAAAKKGLSALGD